MRAGTILRIYVTKAGFVGNYTRSRSVAAVRHCAAMRARGPLAGPSPAHEISGPASSARLTFLDFAHLVDCDHGHGVSVTQGGCVLAPKRPEERSADLHRR
jgi:hypothetical protein